MAIALAAAPSGASPNVSLDDPVYDELDQLELAGELPPSRGGLAPLTAARIHELLPDAPALPAGWWIRPIDRAAMLVDAAHETARHYSTDERPRNIAGTLALSCEGREGRPCGQGLGLGAELDAAAGYGAWAAGAVRVRARTGSDDYTTALDLDRAYLNVEVGPLAAEIGRDVLVLGPATTTQPGWSANAPPLDHIRLSGARPLALGARLRANVVYVLGRLAAPQTYPGDLVSIARGQLEIDHRLEIGVMQLLQLGGSGAPGFSPWDFVLEHLRRRDPSATATDSSNRRVGLDVTAHIAGFGGARLSYQLVFEDLRRQIASAVRYDADHVVGLHTRWLSVEWHKTGVRSYEHIPRLTGFTNGGRIVGDPLGPASQAVFVGGRIAAPWGVVAPWAEVAWLDSDTYAFLEDGPVVRTGGGPTELRLRAGVRAHVPIARSVALDPEVAIEDVEHASFDAGTRHINTVVRAVLVWQPGAEPAR